MEVPFESCSTHFGRGCLANSFNPANIYPLDRIFWRRALKPASIRLALTFLALSITICSAANAQNPATPKPQPKRPSFTPEGHWGGSLQAGEAVLHLVLHISKADDGSLKATIDSLDQGVYGIEATSLEHKDATIRFNVSSVGASYEGKFSPVRGRIEGEWTQ